jgi:hypothetical protein
MRRSGLRWTVAILILAGAVFVLSLVATKGAFLWGKRAEEFRDATDLKSLAIALYMYADSDYWPPLSSAPGRLMFEMDTLYPEHITDPLLLLSPADPIRREVKGADLTPAFCFENSSYFYIGYTVWDDETVEAFADACRKRLEERLAFDSDLAVDLPIEKLYRLDQGGGHYYGFMSPSELNKPKWEHLRLTTREIPCLIERPHLYPGPFGLHLFAPVPLSKPIVGGTVLYQDGHTEFIRCPGKWPMTEKTISTLTALAALD